MSALYRLTGHRPSSLPTAQFCGQSPILGAQYGSSRLAHMGTAFHAICSGTATEEMFLRLSPDERAEIDTWHPPADVDVGGATLRYADAEKELAVGLAADGTYVAPGDDNEPAECLTGGTLDLAWVHEVDGKRIAYVGDLKKARWSVSDGPQSLQLVAYALAYADWHGVDYWCPGIWDCTEGVWQWGKLVDFYSLESAAWLAVVQAAASNTGEYVTGAHCRGCWSRLHCPEFVLPATVVGTALAPLAEGRGITHDNAHEVLHFIQSATDVLKAARSTIEAWVAQNGPIKDPVTGKVWRAINMPGREGVDIKALKAALGDDATPFIKRGLGFQQYRWLKK
jgi:hypothetical protein